ncbi:TonB-dependent receptor [Rhizomicrobium palustre]
MGSAVANTADTSSQVESVVITGSRLVQTNLSSPVPVSSVISTDIEAAGVENISSLLRQMPVIGNGLNGSNSQGQATNVGLNLISLRNLGVNRTLTLVDGHRQVAATPGSAAIDLNTIPAALVDRVEIVTGGTSAVYGADAVSGVVNVILKKDFEGFQARLHSGITAYGDGATLGAEVTMGTNVAQNRGNLVMDFLYDRTNGVKATARDYGVSGFNYIRNPANTGNNDGIPNNIQRPNIRFNGASANGYFCLSSCYNFTGDAKGVTPYNNGAIGNMNGRSIGGDGGFYEQYDNLSLPLERFALMSKFTYHVADNVDFFFSGRYVKTKVTSSWQPPESPFAGGANPVFSIDNPYLPASVVSLMTNAGVTSTQFWTNDDNFGQRTSKADRNMQSYTFGIEGKVFSDWSYQLYGSYGDNIQSTRLLNGRDFTRYNQAIDVVMLNGAPACRSATARAAGCLPLNEFGVGNANPAAVDWVRANDIYQSSTRQLDAGASLTGSLFTLPAGTVDTAIGVEFRQDSGRTQPSWTLQTTDINYPRESPVSGHVGVSEGYGEVRVPIVKDLFLVNDLTVQGAIRYSSYNNNGGHLSWNAGGTYSPISSLRFRAMRSLSVRAPNITELFSPVNQNFTFAQDPCDTSVINQSANRAANCAALGVPAGYVSPQNGATLPGTVGGNPALKPETSNTWTLGAAFTPDFLPGFTATLDYFNIKISDAIGTIPIQSLLNNCVDLPGPVTGNVYCAQITRAANHTITNVAATQLNVGRLSTSGFDFNANYNFDLADIYSSAPGRLSLGLTATYLDKLRQLTDAKNPATELKLEGTLGVPKWNMLGSATYTLDNFSFTWRAHFIGSTFIEGSMSSAAPPPPDAYDMPNTGAKVFNDISLDYAYSSDLDIRFNVDNIFNTLPPTRGNNIHQGIYGASIYPNLGTTFGLTIINQF